jgi:hypothetical protein
MRAPVQGSSARMMWLMARSRQSEHGSSELKRQGSDRTNDRANATWPWFLSGLETAGTFKLKARVNSHPMMDKSRRLIRREEGCRFAETCQLSAVAAADV